MPVDDERNIEGRRILVGGSTEGLKKLTSSGGEGVVRISPVQVRMTPFIAEGGEMGVSIEAIWYMEGVG